MPGNDIYLLVAQHNSCLSVLKETKVMWAARVDHIPISLRVGTFTYVVQMHDHLRIYVHAVVWLDWLSRCRLRAM